MIPKLIHYCWFGNGEKSQLVRRCMDSWTKYCPDYQIVEWNEGNYDVRKNEYLKYCYENKKYAFLSDYVRLDIIYQYGGIYLDTDVELLKPLDEFLNDHLYLGFENEKYVNTGIGFGAEKNSSIVKLMLEEYDYFSGEILLGCPVLNTQAMVKCGLQLGGKKQSTDKFTVYPSCYFNPYDDAHDKLSKTRETVSIHWYSKSWYTKKELKRFKLAQMLRRFLGDDVVNYVKGKVYGKD